MDASKSAFLALLPIALTAPSRAAGQQSCESLTNLDLPDVTIVSATPIPAGTFTPPPPYQPIPNLPAFCRVVGVATPTSDSIINFEVWLPTIWNGKFNGGGNGGYGGSFSTPYGWMAGGLRRGYVTAGTDMGHDASITPGASWALGHPEKIADWGYRANHVTSVAGKAILRAFYGQDARLSYFTGCSDGGHEGLMEAQRYPSDYDAILAGASANYWTHQSAAWVWEQQRQALDDPTSIIPSSKLPVISQAAVAACDAKDGVVDGLIGEPRRCDFDPITIECPGPDGPNCLTAAQVQALKEIYAGPSNPRTGEQIYPGLEPGGEYGWPGDAGSLGRDFYKYMVFEDPKWDYHTLDFDQDIALADKMLAPIIDSTSSDLSQFKSRGGKLLMYHGWNDPRVNPRNSINYFESVVAAQGGNIRATQEFFRLIMQPGMGHCAGGPGLNTFDAFTALEQWVEQGAPPERIVASNAGLPFPDNVMTPGTGSFTRPLCVYPQESRYRGEGSTDDAPSFNCEEVGITPLPFVDSFSGTTIDLARWSVNAMEGTAAEGDGTLTLTPNALTGSSRILVASNAAYDLTGSEASVRVNQVVNPGHVNNIFALQLDWDNTMLWWYENGFLYAIYYAAGVRTNVASLEYSPELHGWWRIREYNGVVYWETSPDGASWDIQGGAATSRLFALQALNVMLEANTFGDGSSDPGQARYSNLTVK
jgi:feruloyl esterase